MLSVKPLGDRAFVVDLGDTIDADAFHRVQSLKHALEQSPPHGMTELVPAFTSVAVYYDACGCRPSELAGELKRMADLVLREASSRPSSRGRGRAGERGRVVEIPVCYGGEWGEDLEVVAEHCGVPVEEVIAIHSGGEYLVHMIGFTPGFPYLGGLSPRIATPRRTTPRLKVAAGSVGIAGEQTGIYPLESPGGWQIIGRTPLALFDAQRRPPSLLQAGDVVRFRPISAEEFRAEQGRHA